MNANGPQDLIVYALTRNGRVETTNYRTVKLPANVELPTYTRAEFGKFYKALFENQSKREDYRVVWTEYFWDMAWCDPCAADPLPAYARRLEAEGFVIATGSTPRRRSRDRAFASTATGSTSSRS